MKKIGQARCVEARYHVIEVTQQQGDQKVSKGPSPEIDGSAGPDMLYEASDMI